MGDASEGQSRNKNREGTYRKEEKDLKHNKARGLRYKEWVFSEFGKERGGTQNERKLGQVTCAAQRSCMRVEG